MNSIQGGFCDVIATDSCYYLLGTYRSDSTNSYLDQTFAKMDLNGNMLFNHFIHSDTTNISPWESNLLETFQNSFVTMGRYHDSFIITEYDPNGVVLDSAIIDTFDVFLDRQYTGYCRVRQKPDSSYACFGSIMGQGAMYICFMHISQSFELLNSGLISTISGYPTFRVRDVLEADDGYLISATAHKTETLPEDNRTRTVFIKTDFDGIEQWRMTDLNTDYRSGNKGLTETVDGCFLYGGSKGWYSYWGGHQYLPSITKIDVNMNILWDLEVNAPDSAPDILSTCYNIYPKSEDKFIGVGNYLTDSMSIGFMIEFDLDGSVIWESEFNLIGPTQPNWPRHEIFSIDETSDGGYVMVGVAFDAQNFADTGDPSSFGWVIKTDSVGCLVPGCQDFLSQDKPEDFEFEMYPNPASDYMYVKTSQQIQGNIQVFDMTGNLVLEWKASPYNMSYIVDVSTLDPGNYILKSDNDLFKGEKFVVFR